MVSRSRSFRICPGVFLLTLHILLCGPADPREVFTKLEDVNFPNVSGGIPVNELAKGLTKLGVRVTIVTTSPEINVHWNFSQDLLSMYICPQRKRARNLALSFFRNERNSMLEVINKLEFDLIHAHWTYEYALVALSQDKPSLITAHDSPFTILRYMRDLYRFFRILMSLKVRFKLKNLTVISPYILAKWRNQMFWRKPTEVIPNIAPFKVNREIFPRMDSSRVLSIGSDNKIKNIKRLLVSWPLVLQTFPEAELDLVGYGLGENDRLRQWAMAKNLDKSVNWHGFVDRESIRNLLNNAGILVHPSLEESFGLTPLEAMAFGVPIVAGIFSGAIPYIVGDAGLLVDVRIPAEIANGIVRLFENVELRNHLGSTGKARIMGEFSSEKVSKSYISEYMRILG